MTVPAETSMKNGGRFWVNASLMKIIRKAPTLGKTVCINESNMLFYI